MSSHETAQSPTLILDSEAARAAAQDAIAQDSDLFTTWLNEIFPYSLAEERRTLLDPAAYSEGTTLLDTMYGDKNRYTELWNRESVAKAIAVVNNGEQIRLNQFYACNGMDWIAGDIGWRYFGVIGHAPARLEHPQIQRFITDASRFHVRERHMPTMHNYGGLIVKTANVVAQYTDVDATAGFRVDRRDGQGRLPGTLIVRAWRTP
jgi:hypothetical protein